MAKRGPKPTPTALLKLRGSWRAKGRGEEPEPPVSIPTAPKFLKGEALAEWDRITVLLAKVGCVAEQDRALLSAYCIEWARYVRANNQLRFVRSLLATTTRGTKMAHPLIRVSDRALANMLRICQEFGLSPAARTQLNVEAASVAEDPLEQLIRQKIERRKKARFFEKQKPRDEA